MAGMPNATAERLEYVLKVRGLGQLLQAGKILHPAGVDLIVASPVFGNPDLAQALRRHPLNGWADGALRIAETGHLTVTVPAIFDQCDLFVFPYAEPITRFTPTSIVESLLSGVPVVMSDLPFLCELAPQFEAVETFRNGDAGDLAQKVLGLLDAPNRLEELSQRARTAAERHFSIQTSARRLLDLAQGSAAIGS